MRDLRGAGGAGAGRRRPCASAASEAERSTGPTAGQGSAPRICRGRRDRPPGPGIRRASS